jgi:outer membrane receptor protein involved in Fe transport
MQTRSSPFRGLSFALTLLAAPLAGAQESDEDIEEIVVLGAESEASGDFAAADSVTGFGAEDLAALGVQDISDLASFTPNLEIVTAGATTPTFFIRGVGLNDFNANSTGAVAIFRDDVAINAPALQLGTLFDVEAVNILRGPQGTGLNRNASAGSIKIYSRKPSGDFGGYLRTDFGNFDYMDYEGAFEAPIYGDLMAARVAFRLSQRDGTMRNRCAGAPPFGSPPRVPSVPPGLTEPPASICGEVVPTGFDPVTFQRKVSHVPPGLAKFVNDVDNWAARGTLLFQPTLDMTWLLNGHGSRRDELSRLGQAIGTSGFFCEDPTKICTIPGPPLVPPELFDPSVQSNGLLGGSQAGTNQNTTPNNGYITREIRQRYEELAPCVVAVDLLDQCAFQPLDVRLAANRAKIQIANELAQELDSEPWEGDFDLTGPLTNETWGAYLNGDVALPWGMKFATTTAVDAYDRLMDIDLDFSPQTLFHIKTDDEGFEFYQSLKLEGQLDQESRLRWEVGGWYLYEKLDVLVENDFGELTVTSAAGVEARDYTQTLSSAAGYGSFAFDFLGDFTLDGGVRFNWEQKDLDMLIEASVGLDPEGCSRPAPGEPLRCLLDETWSAPTGTLRLTYRFREDTHVSAKYTRGWKPGTFNATASQFTGPTVAEPEKLDAFEVGLRGAWFEGRFGLDASLFYYAYENYQIFTARQFLGGNPEFVILNASEAEVYGAEADATARPWEGAFWNVRFSWLETQFLDFLQVDQFLVSGGGQGVPVVFRERQASGNQLLNSPNFKVSMTAEQTVPLGRYGSLIARYDGVWTDTTFYDSTEGRGLGDPTGEQFLPDGTIAQGPFWLHNLRLGWRSPSGRIEVAGWVRNLEDTAYKTFAFDGSSFQSTTIYFVGDPRTYGVSLAVQF